MFKYLILVNPLGFMYGSAGSFLSPENLVGRSGSKFPPEAATLSGLFFSVNHAKKLWDAEKLTKELYVAGPFWGEWDNPEYFYVPIPWSKTIAENESNEWKIKNGNWYSENSKLEPYYQWQRINFWNEPAESIRSNGYAEKSPWNFVSVLHPKLKDDERCTLKIDDAKGGLFLENSVHLNPDHCLVYLSTHDLPEGWYRFGGENHIVEIKKFDLLDDSPILELLRQPIEEKFALITPGIWGSNRFSHRCPQNEFFSNQKNIQMLTDKPIPYRYRVGNRKTQRGRLGRGRYAVPSGSVYVLEKPINKSWWDWDEEWFPKEGFSLKKMGCGLCLPIDIEITGVA
ncbi:MAG: CRISPR-associated protein [Nostoc sp. EkiNYC01]|nr:CRISPR-associated protein [Nostoc sp. EkiNYC01]